MILAIRGPSWSPYWSQNLRRSAPGRIQRKRASRTSDYVLLLLALRSPHRSSSHRKTKVKAILLQEGGDIVDLALMDNRIKTAVIVTGASCFVLVEALLADMQLIAAIAKIVASSGFLTVAYLGGALQSSYGKILLLGLALSFLGDAFLIGESRQAFLGGLAAFLLAHIAYVASFVVNGVNLRWMSAAAIPVAAIAFAVSTWLAPHTPPELAVPVKLYTAVISGMVIAAVGTRGKGGSVLILVGALLFFLSDLSVASLRLVHTDFPTYLWGLPLYYAGQLCLALSVSQSRSH